MAIGGLLDETVGIDVEVIQVARGRGPHLLVQVRGHGSPTDFPLIKSEIVLGRDASADIPMLSGQCSRTHATLTLKAQEYTIRDCTSRHGILLNGVNVHSAVLRDGDLLQLGDILFVYRGP